MTQSEQQLDRDATRLQLGAAVDLEADERPICGRHQTPATDGRLHNIPALAGTSSMFSEYSKANPLTLGRAGQA
jgi:hypothetical protein